MSYLLTEIALEMLGYKFYDTNGVHHWINFQQPMSAAQSDNQTNTDEPTLMEFIDQPLETDSEKKGLHPAASSEATTSSISINLRDSTVRALAKLMEFQGDTMCNGNESQPVKRSSSFSASSSAVVVPGASLVLPKKATNLRRTPAKALAKIMDYENFNIRSQMTNRMQKTIMKEVPPLDEYALKNCLDAEVTKITKDANDMKEFRLFLEDRLGRIDSGPYEIYLRTFGTD